LFSCIIRAAELFSFSLQPTVSKSCVVPAAALYTGTRKALPKQLRAVGIQNGSDKQAEAFSAFIILNG